MQGILLDLKLINLESSHLNHYLISVMQGTLRSLPQQILKINI